MDCHIITAELINSIGVDVELVSTHHVDVETASTTQIDVEVLPMIELDAVQPGDLEIDAVLENSGLSDSLCPIIDCIDGGAPNTAIYGPINGLLNGGTP